MKIIEELYLKITVFFFLFLISNIRSLNFGLLKKNYKYFHKEQTIQKGHPIDEIKKNEIYNKPIKFNGWVKYLHYRDSDGVKPIAFNKNVKFDMQKRNPVALAQSNDSVILLNLMIYYWY